MPIFSFEVFYLTSERRLDGSGRFFSSSLLDYTLSNAGNFWKRLYFTNMLFPLPTLRSCVLRIRFIEIDLSKWLSVTLGFCCIWVSIWWITCWNRCRLSTRCCLISTLLSFGASFYISDCFNVVYIAMLESPASTMLKGLASGAIPSISVVLITYRYSTWYKRSAMKTSLML